MPATEPAISGSFIHADGTVHQFRVTASGYQQWGDADTEHLGRTVEILDALRDSADEWGFFDPAPEADAIPGDWEAHVGSIIEEDAAYWLDRLPRAAVIRDGRQMVWVKGPHVTPGAADVWRGNGHAWSSDTLVSQRSRTYPPTTARFEVLWLPEQVGSGLVAPTEPPC